MSTIQDASHQPGAVDRAQEPPDIWPALMALGYTVVGQTESAGGALRLLNHVLRSPDGRAFAMPEQSPDGKKQLVYFRSMLHDGTILDTAGAPQVSPWLAIPPRLTQPVSGYRCQRFPGATPERLHQEHHATLSRLESERSSGVVTADCVGTYLVLSRRVWALARTRMFVSLALTVLAAAVPVYLLWGDNDAFTDNPVLRAVAMTGLMVWVMASDKVGTLAAARLPVGPHRLPWEQLRAKYGDGD
jgi:hypothetical protein